MPVRLEKMGECILRLRKERGYSLEELAGLILSSPDELRKIERGTVNRMGQVTVEKMQKEYDIQREEKQEEEKTEQIEKEEQVLPKREPEKAAPRL